MAKTYTPQGINDTTQYPEDLTFVAGTKDNLAFGVTIPSVADASAVTGLDASQVQLVYDITGDALEVSPVGATTFTKTGALV